MIEVETEGEFIKYLLFSYEAKCLCEDINSSLHSHIKHNSDSTMTICMLNDYIFSVQNHVSL